jgi:hypothetical protein
MTGLVLYACLVGLAVGFYWGVAIGKLWEREAAAVRELGRFHPMTRRWQWKTGDGWEKSSD